MKKVAVFGNAGGGKSTLSKSLAEMTGLPLVALDNNCGNKASSNPKALWFERYRCFHSPF